MSSLCSLFGIACRVSSYLFLRNASIATPVFERIVIQAFRVYYMDVIVEKSVAHKEQGLGKNNFCG
jgi:hypothetical protein